MRILRTVVRKKGVRLAAAVLLTAAVPAAVIAGMKLLPQTIDHLSCIIDISSMFREKDKVNNGAAMLYETSASEPEPAVIDGTVSQTVSEEQPEILPEEPDVPVNTDMSAQTDTDEYKMTLNLPSEKEDLTSFITHSGKIYEETFGRYSGSDYIDLDGGGQIRNCTELSANEIKSIADGGSSIVIDRGIDEPQVLIVHTHTSESFEPYRKDWYDSSYTSRSADPGNGVIAVGEAISTVLAENGISVIHDCTMHDSVYTGAYSRSMNTVCKYLAEYPSIKIVLDIHRDAIEYEDGSRVSAVTDINGRKAAQVMIICAADNGEYDVPGFRSNLAFAGELQRTMESAFPTLTRPVLFQYCQYNQQLSSGALLIEVGSHGNSADQAVYSGELIGKAIAILAEEKSPSVLPASGNIPLYFLERLM